MHWSYAFLELTHRNGDYKLIPAIKPTTTSEITTKETTRETTTLAIIPTSNNAGLESNIPTSDCAGLQSGRSTCSLTRANPPPSNTPTVSPLTAAVQHAQNQNDCAQKLVSNVVDLASQLLIYGNTHCLFLSPTATDTAHITYSVEMDPYSPTVVDRIFLQLDGIFLGCDDPYMTVYYDLQASHPYLDKRQCKVFYSSTSTCRFYCDAISSCTEAALSVTVLMQIPPWNTSERATPKWCSVAFGVEWVTELRLKLSVLFIFAHNFCYARSRALIGLESEDLL